MKHLFIFFSSACRVHIYSNIYVYVYIYAQIFIAINLDTSPSLLSLSSSFSYSPSSSYVYFRFIPIIRVVFAFSLLLDDVMSQEGVSNLISTFRIVELGQQQNVIIEHTILVWPSLMFNHTERNRKKTKTTTMMISIHTHMYLCIWHKAHQITINCWV